MGSRVFTTEALVVGSMRYGEADRILTLYTRDRGRVGAIAKGLRRARSKVGGRLEPFSLVEVTLYAGHSLYTVVGTETLRTFQGVRDCLFRMDEGARLCAAVRRLFPAEEQNVAAFNLLVRGVARLATAEDSRAAALVVLATRVKLLAALGYAPDATCCVSCGRTGAVACYSPARGGLLCPECVATEGSADGFSVSAGAVAALHELLDRPLAEVAELGVGIDDAAQIEQVMSQTLAYHGH